MLLAEKANRRVRIVDEKKDEYIGMGYTVKNMDGSLVKAPADPKKQVKELEVEVSSLKSEKAELEAALKKTAEEAETASGARMDLLNSIREENENLKAKNADLIGRLEEATKYAKNADKRIAELEAELKKTSSSESPKKEAKPKQADK